MAEASDDGGSGLRRETERLREIDTDELVERQSDDQHSYEELWAERLDYLDDGRLVIPHHNPSITESLGNRLKARLGEALRSRVDWRPLAQVERRFPQGKFRLHW